jgi:hypothetical protein
VTHKPIESDGLFQISVQDSIFYKGACSGVTAQNIFTPEVNENCAMEIATHLLNQGRSLGAYWQTARVGSKAMNYFKSITPECF